MIRGSSTLAVAFGNSVVVFLSLLIIQNDHEVGTIVQPNMIRLAIRSQSFRRNLKLVAGLYLETDVTSARQF